MDNITNWWQKFLNNTKLRRATVLLLIILVLYLCRSMMTTILLTFIFTLLITKLVLWIRTRIKIPIPILVIVIYLLIIGAIILVSVLYLPKIVEQGAETTKTLITFYESPHSIKNPQVRASVLWLLKNFNVPNQIKGSMNLIFSYITSIGTTGIAMFMSLLLSFFFTLELKQVKRFSKKFLTSTFGWFFSDILYFAKTFVKTFGVVIEAQFFIAICNTTITTICLWIMQIPQLLILAVMIFFLSLIPVAGVIISLIPLTLVGYTVGGFRYVIYIFIIIMLVHLLEAYVLNPKFMSAKTELPIFFTFVVLLVGEHIFGTWGLIVSVPIFTFLLDVLGVQNVDDVGKNKKPGWISKLMKKCFK
ncbi:AI-2E family transporter [Fructilactobacillus fructivorans]|uniref:AI-2E family transporter n=1 Tax=Fructilactobacillus fructivorans TaxID=1614 RepID=UPI000704CF72|nr:AI-2E family transporter [Fructilactobacillus fructivorans]KRN42954.1 permease [Fructilactobacillus fructivorans]